MTVKENHPIDADGVACPRPKRSRLCAGRVRALIAGVALCSLAVCSAPGAVRAETHRSDPLQGNVQVVSLDITELPRVAPRARDMHAASVKVPVPSGKPKILAIEPAAGSAAGEDAVKPSAPQDKPDSDQAAPAQTGSAMPPPSAALKTAPVTPVQPQDSGVSPQPKPQQPVEIPPAADAGKSQASGVTKSADTPDSDLYYDDSVILPPSGPMAKVAGPRKVDPALEPASKYVVVEKNAKATDREAMVVSAQRALDMQRYDAALDLYDKLYAKNKRDPRILMGRAIALQNLGRREAAIQGYEDLLKISPDNADALVNMMGLIAQDYPEVALRRLLDLREKHADDPGLAAQIGLTQAKLGNLDEALQYLGTAASLDPDNASHVFNMAVVTDKMGKPKDAIPLYEKALEIDAVHGESHSIPRDAVYDRLSVLRRQ